MELINELTPQSGLEKVSSLLDEFSDSSKHVNMRVLELIVKLEERVKSSASSSEDLIERINQLEKENEEWMNAFNAISDKLTQIVQVNTGVHSTIFDKADELSALMDAPYQTVSDVYEDTSGFTDDEFEDGALLSPLVLGVDDLVSPNEDEFDTEDSFDSVDNNSLIPSEKKD